MNCLLLSLFTHGLTDALSFRNLSACLILCIAFAASMQAVASTPKSTTTTQYIYNSDGALTQIITQQDDNPAEQQYLVWDNFIPDSDNPQTGTVLSGNGNLSGTGPTPDSSQFSQTLVFDQHNRLQSLSNSEHNSQYRYHPDWMMANSQLDQNDTLHFYYNIGRHPAISNIEQASDGTVSGRLGSLRSFSDNNAQQILLSPLKDVSGVYDPATEQFFPLLYDPFGNQEDSDNTPQNSYDVLSNPYQFAGEYKDPVTGNYYLRTRWYQPEWHGFLSRDPALTLNRYAYAAGNPVVRIDPSGRKYRSYKKAMRPLSHFLHKTTGCKRCVAGRLFLGTFFSPLSLLADPAGFYHTEFAENGGFGIKVLMGTVAMQFILDSAIPEENYLVSYGLRLAGDVIAGTGNAAVAATSHNFHRFSKRTFFQGLEYTAGDMFYTRVVFAGGYRPFNKTLDDIEKMRQSLETNEEVLVFKLKANLNPKLPIQNVGPLGDMLDMGLYHEVLVGVTRDKVFFNEFGAQGASFYSMGISEEGLSEAKGLGEKLNKRWNPKSYQYVGKAERFSFVNDNRSNPLGVEVYRNVLKVDKPRSYNFITLNCQRYVTAIVNKLNFID